MRKMFATTFAVAAAALLAAGSAFAYQAGQPTPGALNFQAPVTSVARDIQDLHDLILWIIAAITLFVTALLAWVAYRYNAKRNPTPARWTHNTTIEIIWTLVPVLILVIIAVPSLRLLIKQEDFTAVKPDLVIKATGNQWYWGYEYPDHGISFDSIMLTEEEVEKAGLPKSLWKLATDTTVVVPVGKTVVVQVVAGDVIHAWTIPSFGIKVDAMPGRTNQVWFNVEKVGDYYGQCSELCGKDHSYMPIHVKAVSPEEFEAWVAEQKNAKLSTGTNVAQLNN